MEMLLYTIAAIILYLVSDKILDLVEQRIGRRFQQRTLIFFGILLGLAVVTFWVIRQIMTPAGTP